VTAIDVVEPNSTSLVFAFLMELIAPILNAIGASLLWSLSSPSAEGLYCRSSPTLLPESGLV
jgi:hypothetical protein